MQTNIPELLAPAGTMEQLEAAILYGADAVYLGGGELSLRAGRSFKGAYLEKAVALCHKHGVRVYFCLNAYVRQKNWDSVQSQLEHLAIVQPDAIIIADAGIFSLARSICKHIPIHLSTQANTCNAASAQFWHEQGAKRVNLARELSCIQIHQIQQELKKSCPDLELECFVHGALCLAISGQCLMSAWLNDRPANEGLCTQPCRYKYRAMQAPAIMDATYNLDASSNMNESSIMNELNSEDFCTQSIVVEESMRANKPMWEISQDHFKNRQELYKNSQNNVQASQEKARAGQGYAQDDQEIKNAQGSVQNNREIKNSQGLVQASQDNAQASQDNSQDNQALLHSNCDNNAQNCHNIETNIPNNSCAWEEQGDYSTIWSPDDICLIRFVPWYLRNGISSLKIEGRMRTGGYVAHVVDMYRHALTMAQNNNFNIENYVYEIGSSASRPMGTGFFIPRKLCDKVSGKNMVLGRAFQERELKSLPILARLEEQLSPESWIISVRSRWNSANDVEILMPGLRRPKMLAGIYAFEKMNYQKTSEVHSGTNVILHCTGQKLMKGIYIRAC